MATSIPITTSGSPANPDFRRGRLMQLHLQAEHGKHRERIVAYREGGKASKNTSKRLELHGELHVFLRGHPLVLFLRCQHARHSDCIWYGRDEEHVHQGCEATVVTHLSGASPDSVRANRPLNRLSPTKRTDIVTPVSPASLVFLSGRLVQLQAEHRHRRTNIAGNREGGKAKRSTGRRTVERLRLSDRTAHLCQFRVRNSSLNKFLLHPKREQLWRAFLGGIMACHTNPWLPRSSTTQTSTDRTQTFFFFLLHSMRSEADPIEQAGHMRIESAFFCSSRHPAGRLVFSRQK